ncbi:adhesion G-protein coupled receptor F3-like [Engystomops pustulosus]|uniref:adhesion G-protein coupled receptor F3-like n=1 Tax=Engystomops pustulosus TaxID=76066 RepID=UPI003AFAEC8B
MMNCLVTAIVLWCLLITVCLLQVEGAQPQDNIGAIVNQASGVPQRVRRAPPAKPPACYFPFIANGVSYTSCTMAGQTRAYWCATTDNFDRDGKWSWCTGPGYTSYLACVFPFQYNGLNYTACIQSALGYTWCSTAYSEKSGTAIYCLEVDFKLYGAGITSGTAALGLLPGTTPAPIDPTSYTTEALSTTSSLNGGTSSTVNMDTPPETSSPALETSPTTVSTSLSNTVLQPLSSIPLGMSYAESSTISQTTGETSGVTELSSTSITTTSSTSTTTSSTSITSTSPTLFSSTTASVYNSSDWKQLMDWFQNTFMNLSTDAGLGIIPDLQRYTSLVSLYGFHKEEEELILQILGNITKNVAEFNLSFPVSAMMDILSIVNELLNNTSWRQSSSSVIGPQILGCFENLLERMEMVNSSFTVSYDNIDFHCVVAPCVNMSNETALSIEPHVSLALPQEDSQQTFAPSCLVNILLLSSKTQNIDFPGQYEGQERSSSAFEVDSNILTSVMKIDSESFHHPYVNLTFRCSSGNYCDHMAICAFWNFTTHIWSSEGCTTEIDDGVTHCYCHHLTSFSVLIAKYIPNGLKNNSALDYITIAGLAISIASLVLCITFQVYLMKFPMNLVAYYRHMAILNVSIFLLLSYLSFIAASYITPKEHIRLCVGLTFCTHFSLLAFFCWTLVQSIYLFCRLVFVFHHITKKEFMSLSVGLGYVCPSIIAMGTFLYYTPTNDYQKDNACWLESDSGATLAFNIPTIIILSINFLILLVVIRKILRPSISEGNNDDEEVIKKLMKAVVFCTPQFGLTWAVGIPLLSDGSLVALHYLFVILNPLQGFFIFIFGCLLDKKVMDLIKNRMSKTPMFSSTATTVSSY